MRSVVALLLVLPLAGPARGEPPSKSDAERAREEMEKITAEIASWKVEKMKIEAEKIHLVISAVIFAPPFLFDSNRVMVARELDAKLACVTDRIAYLEVLKMKKLREPM